jgi:hydrogenase maturation protease
MKKESFASDRAFPDGWREALEREVTIPKFTVGDLATCPYHCTFEFTAHSELAENIECTQQSILGTIDLSVQRIRDQLLKVLLQVQNVTPYETDSTDRDAALSHSLVSMHAVLGLADGEFISLLEPTSDVNEVAATCQNAGWWPVLVGDPGDRDTLLASPIILYDYPKIAPESAGDLFDGTEIDEILSLRILTLTDDEKREIRQSDERARQILERTESMPAEQFMKLHGAVRALRPLKEDRP